MRRASIITIFLCTSVIFLLSSCTTFSEPAESVKTVNTAGSESTDNNSSSSRNEAPPATSQQVGSAAEPKPKPVTEPEPEQNSGAAPESAQFPESGTATEPGPSIEAEIATAPKTGKIAEAESSSEGNAGAAPKAAPRATLPYHLPSERKVAGRFLMLSPQIAAAEKAEGSQTGNIADEKENEGRPVDRDKRSSQSSQPAPSNRTNDSGEEIAAAAGKTETRAETGVEAVGAAEEQDETAEKQEAEKSDIEVIRAGKGEQVHLSLPGFGWIYDRGASDSRGIEFLSRSYADSATEFVFSAGEVGLYTLAFQQQDSSTGTSTRKSIAVEVSRETVQERISAETAAGAAKNGTDNVQSATAGEPEKLQLPSFSFERLENAVLARNSNNTAQQVQALLIGRTSGEATDLPPAEATQSTLTDRQRNLMLEAGELLFDTQREVLAEQLLKHYLDARRKVSANEPIGKALYLLGQIYESPPPPRDERRSVEYYQRIVNFYPTDPYRRRAEERIKYLQRHFLQIR